MHSPDSSDLLFVHPITGTPLQFNITRIPQRSKIIEMIKRGGGVIADEPEQNVISVMESSKITTQSNEFCSPNFIEYCVNNSISFFDALNVENIPTSPKTPKFSNSQEIHIQRSPLRNCEKFSYSQNQNLSSQVECGISNFEVKAQLHESLKSPTDSFVKFSPEQDLTIRKEYQQLSKSIQNPLKIYQIISRESFSGLFSPLDIQCRHELLLEMHHLVDDYYSCDDSDDKQDDVICLNSQPNEDGNVDFEEELLKQSDAALSQQLADPEDLEVEKQILSNVTNENTNNQSNLIASDCSSTDLYHYKRVISNMMTEFDVSAEVIFWALHLHTGNVDAAKYFLKTRNPLLTRAWFQDDDYSLLSEANRNISIGNRNIKECQLRREFLTLYKKL